MSVSRVHAWALASAVSILGAAAMIATAGQALSFENWWGPAYGPRTLADSASPAVATRESTQLSGAAERVRHWNRIATDASGLDHTPEGVGAPHTFGHQLGPGRASRAMAMVHIAMFEAVNAVDRRYESYLGIPADSRASMEAAIARAVHDTLNALYPSQAGQSDRLLADDLSQMPAGGAKQAGIALGRSIADAIVKRRTGDGSAHAESLVGVDYIPGIAPGEWRQDPISRIPVALGVRWGTVTPFVIGSVQAFRVAPPPALDSREYAEAFNEVKRLGGDGVDTSTRRIDDQTLAAIYWAYDGTPALCAPPRLYNQIAMAIADHMGSDVVEQSRLLALVNVAMADAAIAIWESKYFYKFWRPVTAIREADRGTGPTGAGDQNPITHGDETFSPLGAPASNAAGPNFTPPFPAYPSGHAGFGGAVFQMLRNIYRTDDISFTFVSDELNGVTADNDGNIRPLLPRSFASLSEAEEENGQSRIYLGIHWAFDKTAGIAQGRRIANEVFERAFRPLQQ